MANAVVTVLEADGTTETDVTILDVGRQAAAASKSVAMSTEDKAVFDAVAASLAALDNAVGGNELQVDVLTMPTTTVQGTVTANLSATDNTVLDNIEAGIDEVTAKLIAAPATEAKQDSAATILTAIETAITAQTALIGSGDVAHGDANDDSVPVLVAAEAIAGLSTATLVSAADRTKLYAGLDGALLIRPHCGLEDIVTAVATSSSGANQSVVSAQGAGVKFYLVAAVITNSGGAAGGGCPITDGDGGTTKVNIPYTTLGAVWQSPVPIPFSANTAVYANPSGTDTVVITLIGFKSKV